MYPTFPYLTYLHCIDIDKHPPHPRQCLRTLGPFDQPLSHTTKRHRPLLTEALTLVLTYEYPTPPYLHETPLQAWLFLASRPSPPLAPPLSEARAVTPSIRNLHIRPPSTQVSNYEHEHEHEYEYKSGLDRPSSLSHDVSAKTIPKEIKSHAHLLMKLFGLVHAASTRYPNAPYRHTFPEKM